MEDEALFLELRLLKGPVRYAWWRWWVRVTVFAAQAGAPRWVVGGFGFVSSW
jgi:hypothetical protein